MKVSKRFSIFLALWVGIALIPTFGFAQHATMVSPPLPGTIVTPDPRAEQTWREIILEETQASGRQNVTRINNSSGNGSDTSTPLVRAERMKKFYNDFPAAIQSIEARKLEALLLIEAVASGETSQQESMESTIHSFRSDLAMPEDARAEVAGTYEFRMMWHRVKAPGDFARITEEIARALMAEFPGQPQGSRSLLTLAESEGATKAGLMVDEIIRSPAPEWVKERARRLLRRNAVVGRRVQDLLGQHVSSDGSGWAWRSGAPTVVYFWASWSPESLALGETIRGMNLTEFNIIGVALERNSSPAEVSATAKQMPGKTIYQTAEFESPLAVALGIVNVPTVFLASSEGKFTEIGALGNLTSKIQALGK